MSSLTCPSCSAEYDADDRHAPCPGCGRPLPPSRAEWTIGRDYSCSLVVPHPEVSARHCRLFRLADGDYLLEDLASTNGTYLRGRRITGLTRLRYADEVALGPSVVMPWPAQQPSAPTAVAAGAETTLEPWWLTAVRPAAAPTAPGGDGPAVSL